MKKYLALLFLGVLTISVSGCSVGSPSEKSPIASVVKKPSSVMKSVDGGRTWETKSDSLGKVNMDAIDILSLSVNPHNGQNVFVGTLTNGIIKTEDGGENWTALVFPAEKVYGLLNDFSDGRIIYASGVWKDRGKIFKSMNSGTDWDEIYTAPSDGPLVVAMANDRNDSNLLIASTSDKQLIKSTDAGVSWQNIYTSSDVVTKITVDNMNSNVIYIITQNGKFLISRDGGNVFNPSIGHEKKNVSLMATYFASSDIIYTAGKSGILRSKNGGDNWDEIKTLGDADIFPVKALALNPSNFNEIVYGAGQAVYKSIDDGMSWIPFQLETKKSISAIVYDSNNPNIMYMGLRKN